MEKQNTESEDDFLTMQQEAIRRVREMQSRARATLENAGMHIENREPPDAPHASAEASRTQHAESQATPHTAPSQSSQSGSRNDAVHNDAGHNDASHSNASNANTQRSGAAHSNASNANTQRSGAARSDTEHAGASHSSSPHENQRPTEKHSPHREEPPVIHAPGLNIDIESDQLMLLVTLYLLIKDGADKWLILALAYVMLT